MMSLNRRAFIKAGLSAGAGLAAARTFSCSRRGPAEKAAAAGPSEPINLSGVRMAGEWGTRFAAATANLLTRQDRYPIESFAASAAGRPGTLWPDWPGDQVGRWLSVLHVAEEAGWTTARAWRKGVADAALPLQTPEGNFGPAGSASSGDSRIVSGNGFALRGLMDAYADTRETRYLDAARRMARYFEALAPAWERKRNGLLHEFYGHCLDGLAALYELGNDQPALALARRLAAFAGRTEHTHHSLSLCRGLLDVARFGGDAGLVAKVEDYLEWCRGSLMPTGGLPEGMPASEQDEGCGLADWIVVNLMMFGATGRERYLDDAERTLVNHFFMNQFHTGGFGHRALGPEVIGGKNWQGWEGRFGSENPGCCSLWGMWALGQAGRFVATRAGETVFVNLFPDVEIDVPELGARFSLTGDFPRMSRARIRVWCEGRREFTLALRNHSGSDGLAAAVKGKTFRLPDGARRVLIRRTWESGDTVDLRFDTRVRFVAGSGGEPAKVAIFDGPLCLGLSDARADVDAAWTARVGAGGGPELDGEGRPLIVGPSGMPIAPLAPVAEDWQAPDVHNPRRWRILFGKSAV